MLEGVGGNRAAIRVTRTAREEEEDEDGDEVVELEVELEVEVAWEELEVELEVEVEVEVEVAGEDRTLSHHPRLQATLLPGSFWRGRLERRRRRSLEPRRTLAAGLRLRRRMGGRRH
jgi:hypothetical protein